MKKQALGKGIRAFIPEEYGILKEERLADVEIELVRPNPLQPRTNFRDDSIEDLARSVKATGVLQPIVVVPEGGVYKIIIGERRWRAAQKAGLKKVPVLIKQIPREKQVEVSLVENLQREDLNPMEIALAYQRLIQELALTQQEVAEKVGMDRTSITNYLRLLKLPAEIQQSLAEEKLSMGHARALLSVEDSGQQLNLARQAVSRKLSVREVEILVQKLKKKPASKKKSFFDHDLIALEEEFVRLLGTKVSIDGSRNKGVVRIHYFSLDELNRIFDRFKGAS